MKYILILFLLVGISTVQGQKYFFSPAQSGNANQSSRIGPYSIAKNESNKRFISENNVKLVFETQNWFFVNAYSSFMESAEKNKTVSGVFHDLSIPQVLTDSAVIQHQADQVHAGFGGLDTSYTGKGVIIGVIDQGIDYNHPDFQNPDGSTRVLRYWDHSVNGPNTPSEYGYGCVWDENDINQGICTSIETGSTHGTNVAGMAASNASANGSNIGFAPEASLIVVETDFSITNWSLSIAEACDYIFKVADSLDMPAVINISLGSYYGTHDGLDPASEMIDSLLNAKEGRIVVCSRKFW
jgi:subtilisin family serine protease